MISHPLLLGYIHIQISMYRTFDLHEELKNQTIEIEQSVGLASWDWILDCEVEAYKDPSAGR